MVDHAIIFKDEIQHRKDLILQRKLEEEAMNQAQERIKRGRMRINAHPSDVKRDLEQQTISQVLLNDPRANKGNSSQSISNPAQRSTSSKIINLESGQENANKSEDGVH